MHKGVGQTRILEVLTLVRFASSELLTNSESLVEEALCLLRVAAGLGEVGEPVIDSGARVLVRCQCSANDFMRGDRIRVFGGWPGADCVDGGDREGVADAVGQSVDGR